MLAKLPMSTHERLRKTVIVVALANLLYFGVEFGVARHIGSVSLLADSVDFLEDASVNCLIAIGLAWSNKARARLGMVLAAILVIPALAFAWTAYQKLQQPSPPEPWLLSATGTGALVVNLGCAFLLARFRHHGGSLTRAAFLSARNDAIANVAIVAAGGLTLASQSIWPDLVVGFGIALMNLDAAREVWEAARDEHSDAEP
jgi:Co/Zn/Cd efflux system component